MKVDAVMSSYGVIYAYATVDPMSCDVGHITVSMMQSI